MSEFVNHQFTKIPEIWQKFGDLRPMIVPKSLKTLRSLYTYVCGTSPYWYLYRVPPPPPPISVRDKFRSGGGLMSLARIFFPLLARKSNGFARILVIFFVRKWLFQNSRGGGGATAPSAHGPYAYAAPTVPAWHITWRSDECMHSISIKNYTLCLNNAP